MFDNMYIAQVDENSPKVVKEKSVELEQSGTIHSKTAGRFELVKQLPQKAESIENMFTYADAYGKFRLAYIDSAHKISPIPKEVKSATAFGGEIGFNTAQYYGFGVHMSAYFSQSVEFLNPDKADINEDFFNINKDSFAYIAEASLDYNSDYFQSKIGRVRVDTPYANSDDIRMAPNTFEGAWANIDYTDNLKSQLFYFNRWAGYDSQNDISESQDKFKDLVTPDSFGMVGASISYGYAKNSEITLWYNYIDEMSAIVYAEIVGIYFIDGDGFHIDYGAQMSSISELNDSNNDGEVLGAMLIAHYRGAFLAGAYNIAFVDKDNFITNGFGGGPYYTSLDEATIAAISEARPGEDAESFRIGIGYEFENIGLDGLVMEFVYGELYNDNARIKEQNAILTYELNEKLSLEATYTMYDSHSGNNTFDRGLLRIDYNF